MKEPFPRVFNIHRFALDDGPGIRTTIFLKGCPLSCSWCHNPEAISPGPELARYPRSCIRCGTCRDVCQKTAISFAAEVTIDRSRCTACGRCAEACPTSALRRVGSEWSIEQLLELIGRDRHFFAASGGGVTLSGGEPTLWPGYVGVLLEALKTEGVHTAIQTCGMFDYEIFSRKLLPLLDLVMFDLKLVDPVRHRLFTGKGNGMILANFRRLTKDAGERVVPRVPLIPGLTATEENLQGIAVLLSELGYRHCRLLPYNPAGIGKRTATGMEIPSDLPDRPLSTHEEEAMGKLVAEMLECKMEAAAGFPDASTFTETGVGAKAVRLPPPQLTLQ